MESESESSSSLKSKSRFKKAGLVLPVHKVLRILKQKTKLKVSPKTAVNLTSVLEYLVAELLEISGDATKYFKLNRILPREIFLAISYDSEVKSLLSEAIIPEGGVLSEEQKISVQSHFRK